MCKGEGPSLRVYRGRCKGEGVTGMQTYQNKATVQGVPSTLWEKNQPKNDIYFIPKKAAKNKPTLSNLKKTANNSSFFFSSNLEKTTKNSFELCLKKEEKIGAFWLDKTFLG